MRSRFSRFRDCPPWWPDDEPWPPRGSRRLWGRGRQRFMWRAGGAFLPFLIFAAFGLSRLARTLLEQAGYSVSPSVVALGFLGLAWIVAFLFLGGMSRIGSPLGDIVEAADRVGSGDLSVRLVERGPPFLRSVARAFNTMTSRLAAQEQQRRDLMADVAHELRTPLSIMRGRLEGLADGVYPRDEVTLLQLVEETKHLERLVEDLRTLAHAEGGTLKLQRESTDVGVLIGDVVRAFAGAARAGGIVLVHQNGAELPLIDVDPVRIREVVANLVSNALRHTPRGGRVSIESEAAAGELTIRVTDSGAGIAADALATIFDRFAKGVDSTGSGLGLAIAKNLVEAHGGSISVASEVATGTTFTVKLPLQV